MVDVNVAMDGNVLQQPAGIGSSFMTQFNSATNYIFSTLGQNFDRVVNATQNNTQVVIVFVLTMLLAYWILSEHFSLQGKIGFVLSFLLALLAAGVWLGMFNG